jgi:metallo-beta-lactamase class B
MTLKKTLLAIAATAGLLATSASAQAPASWTKAATPFQVIGNIYYVGTEGISAWLITSSKGHILIDGGMPGAAALVEANIKALGFKLSDVDLILNSHAHFDHAGAIAQMKKDTGAVVLAGAGDKAALESGKYIGSEDVAA